MIGEILGGRYEILEEIGKGGMAYVYKAKCTLLNRIVAVKILRDDLDSGDEFLTRFNIEAQAAASLSHSNIVSIFDVGVDRDKHYIIMEYVDGITLKEYISNKTRLDYKEAFDIAYQIANALEAAHQKNIVHRDIKPHNILITNDNCIKVTDFGIARSGSGKTLSLNNDILGSVHYISPEQARGERVDSRSDIYSLGVVIYEMLTGRVPFDSDTPVAVAMKQIQEYPKDIISPEVEVPVSVQQIVFKAMAKDPDLRYQSAAELKEDIVKILDNPNAKISDGDVYTDIAERLKIVKRQKHSQLPLSKKKKSIIVICSVLTALILVSGCTAAVHSNILNNVSDLFIKSKVKVPNLVGYTFEEAQAKCKSLGINFIVQDEIEDEDAKPGAVISQSPQKDEEIKKGESVKVIINKDNGDVVIDDYTGRNYEDVQDALGEKNITVNVIFEESKKKENTVIRQTPQSGTKVDKNSVITIYVSSGVNAADNYIVVPTLTGKTYSQCVAALSSLGLSVGNVTGTTSPENEDIVVSQAIPAGSMVKKNCAVGITVKSSSPIESEKPALEESGTDTKSEGEKSSAETNLNENGENQ